jgi:hypothetical protein
MGARSSRDLSLRLAMCPEWISRPIAFIRLGADRWQERHEVPAVLVLGQSGRNSYPRNRRFSGPTGPTKTARWRRPAGPTTATRVLDLLAIAKAAPPLPARRVSLANPGKGLPPGGHRNGCWSAEQVAPSNGSPRVTK